MKQNRDKILRDKIDSLTELPAGVNVSLASKWELLEAGLAEKKRRRFPLLRVAASVLLIAAGTLALWILLSENTAPQKVIAEAPINAPQSSVQAPTTGWIEEITSSKQKTGKSKSPRKDKVLPALNADFPTQNTPQAIPIIPVPEIYPDITKDKKHPELLAADITLLKGKQAQKSKKRYIELDFGSAHIEPVVNKAPSRQFFVKIPFLHAPDNPETTVLAAKDQSNPLRVQVSF